MRDFYIFADSCFIEKNEGELTCSEWIELNFETLTRAFQAYQTHEKILEELKDEK